MAYKYYRAKFQKVFYCTKSLKMEFPIKFNRQHAFYERRNSINEYSKEQKITEQGELARKNAYIRMYFMEHTD